MITDNNNSQRYHVIFMLALLAWFFVYLDPLVNMVGIWSNSETYKHCYFILPIVLFLIYENRSSLSKVPLQHSLWFITPLLVGQGIYLLTNLAGINVLSQLAAYGSLFCLIGAVYGWRLIKFLLFPICYLVLAVPMGEELVPLLQEVTANISVAIVKLVGIPVYREGLYIYIPNGSFKVAEACAGIRFLISMIAIGVLYAYITYQSPWRRLIFVALSIALPIVANGIRAFGIIYIGHKSDMEHAVGADHLVYGWFFFAFVLFLLLSIGKFWREDKRAEAVNIPTAPHQLTMPTYTLLIAIIPVLFLQPLYNKFIVGQLIDKQLSSPLIRQVMLKAETDKLTSFEPTFAKANNVYALGVNNNAYDLEIFVAQYQQDNKEQELINSKNRLFNIEMFTLIESENVKITVDGDTFVSTVLSLVDISGAQKKLVYWYEIDQVKTSSSLAVKKAQLLDKLSGGKGAGNAVIIAIDNDIYDLKKVQISLEKFIVSKN
jgi:exosortase A